MDSDLALRSPRVPCNGRKFLMDSPRFVELHRTPRSEGFRRHKIILVSPNSSEAAFSTSSPSAWTAETPPQSNSEDGPTPFKEVVCNQIIDGMALPKVTIPEKNFYSFKIQKKKLLPLFNKAEVDQRGFDSVSPQPKGRTPSKRKRSKSLDYKSRSKYVKLQKEVRHGVKKPTLKKTKKIGTPIQSSKKPNNIDDNSESASLYNNVKAPDYIPKYELPSMGRKPKITDKKMSVKVNRMVRMNLECGEIKFTKHLNSPKKTPTEKKRASDALDVPETEDWLKSKVTNILDSLDRENCDMEESDISEKSSVSMTLSFTPNDTPNKLSDASCELEVRELHNRIHPTEAMDKNGFGFVNSRTFGSKENRETYENLDNEIEMACESDHSSSNDVLATETEDLNLNSSGELSDKLYPIFYKSSPGQLKENMPSSSKSPKDSPKFPYKKDFFQCNDGMQQLVIDVGQKALAPSTCSVCGFFYQAGDPSEEKMHKLYHGSSKPAIKHTGWKWERVAVKFPEGRVIRVCPGDPKSWWSKVEAVLEKANDDLGITFTCKIPKDAHAYMYVGDGHIIGCVIVEPIRLAYRMLENDRKEIENADVPEDDKTLELPKMPTFCSNTPVRGSRCGINRMWTCASERRKGIATKILDAIRATFVYGHILRLNEIAFSDPTPLGMAFAQKYTKVSDFFVYQLNKD